MVVQILTANSAAVFAVTSLLFCLGIVISMRRQLHKKVTMLESCINEMSSELKSVNHASMGMGRKIQSIAQETSKLSSTVTEMQKNDPAKVSYSEAARLVSMGAGIEDLMNACGISRPEAELVTALTKNTSASNSEEETNTPKLETRI